MKKIKNKELFAILFFEVFYLFLIFYSKSKEVSPDFRVFYLQSQRFISGGNVFDFNDYVAYNSTFLYLLLAPLTVFRIEIASNIFLILNLTIIPVITSLTTLLIFKKFILEKFVQILAFISLAYFTRSILNNGQVGLIMILLVILSLHLLFNNNGYKNYAGIFLWFAFELKPYLLLPFLIWLFIVGKQKIPAIYFLITGIIFEFIYYLINPSSNILNYIKLLNSRADNVSSELDQSSIASVFRGILNFPNGVSYILQLIVATIVIKRILKYLKSYNLLAVSLIFNVTLIANVYVHRQDPIITLFYFSLMLSVIKIDSLKKLEKILFIVMIILLANWGNSNIYSALFMDILLLFILYPLGLRFRAIVKIYLICVLMQSLQIAVLIKFGWIHSYELWRILILVYLLICSVLLPNNMRKLIHINGNDVKG